ncbi:MAG: tripartite tricarboxylate transporter substrate binding protein [Rhizobiales bacterium]|nr:tripartite tricarboxylate transporter substrate binding protein [Hyphomicrobiales bacterium]
MVRMKHWSRIGLAAGALLTIAAATALAQQSYPVRPVHIVLPMPAGGAMDALARALGQKFQERTGQPLVVENKPGGNTLIAASACKNANSDGYTLCLLTTSSISINPELYKKLPYQPEKDFEPVTQLAVANSIIILSKKVPANNLAELVKYSQENPDKLNYASFGVGGDSHLVIEWLKKKTGLKATHVPFRGGAPAMMAFEAGSVQMLLLIVGNANLPERIAKGEVTGLLVPGDRRIPQAPNVPTFKEAGLPTFESRTWFGVFAPAGTPKPVVDKVQSEIASVINVPEFRDRMLTPHGFNPVGSRPDDFKSFLLKDRANGRELVEISGVRIE